MTLDFDSKELDLLWHAVGAAIVAKDHALQDPIALNYREIADNIREERAALKALQEKINAASR